MSVAAARPAPGNLDVERVLAHHRRMWRIRAFELAAEQAMGEGLVYGAIHLSVGQEAVASGVIVNLAAEDYIATTHRGHGHCIARGADIERMYAELFGRAGGYCRGKGGSMHIADFKIGMLGANGVVADGLPIAVGAAQAIRLKREPGIVVVFFGDGAINRGPFMESLNWAKVYGLPVLFVCEDNGYAATTRNDSVTAGAGAGARAESVGITSTPIDGNDVLAVDEAARALIAAIRGGGGPRFLHARTYRQKGHTAADKAGYRDAAAHERGMGTCPIARSAELLATNGVARTRLDQIRAEAEAEMAAAVARVREQPFAPMSAAFEDVQDVGAPAMEEPWWRR